MGNVHHHQYPTVNLPFGMLACGCSLYRCNECGFTRPVHFPPCPSGTGTSEVPVSGLATSANDEG
jgi:hypothetical protein